MPVKQAKFLLAVIFPLTTVILLIKLPSAYTFTYVFLEASIVSHLNAHVIKITLLFANNDVWMDGRVGMWLYGWMDGWMDGWKINIQKMCVCVCVYFNVPNVLKYKKPIV